MNTELLVIIVDPVDHRGRFRAQLDGRVLVASSQTPFCAAARVLVAEGFDPAARIAMRHAGLATNALTATIGGAARLTVVEDARPHFQPWKPPPSIPLSPSIALNDPPATTLAAPERLTGAPAPHSGEACGGDGIK